MYYTNLKTNSRLIRATLATFMLLMLTTDFAFGQTTTLCERLKQIPVSTTTIDLNTTTATLPNSPIVPGGPPTSIAKSATDRLVLVGNMVTVTSFLVTFNNCDIRMAEGAGFIVPAGKVLRFINCRIAAADCDKLWNKIDAQPGSYVYMTNGNQVEDANIVISAQGATVVCTGNNFNRNYIGVAINTAGQYKIEGNTFERTSDLIKESTNTNRIIFGVIHTGRSLLALKNNTFKGISCGIYTVASSLNIEGGTFLNINKTPHYTGSAKYVGSGIFAQSNSAVKVNNSAVFNACSKSGIYTESSSLDCQHSSFQQIQEQAILCLPGEGINIVSNNDFSGHIETTTGYINMLCTKYSNNSIENNVITLAEGTNLVTNTFAAILLSSISDKTVGSISNNTISGKYPNSFGDISAGIAVSDGAFSILYNRITAEEPTNKPTLQFGIIVLLKSDGSEIMNNEVKSNINGTGIEVQNSKKIALCSNKIIGTQTGLSFAGPCDNSNVIETMFADNSDVALLLNGNGINLGKQSHKANTFPIGSAAHTGNDVDFSQFIVNNDPSTPCGQADFLPQSVNAQQGWFDNKDGCFQGCTQIAPPSGDTELSEYDLEVIDNTLNQYNYSIAETWYAQYNLFDKLTTNPSLNTSDAINDFVVTKSAGNIGAFYNVEKEIQKGLSHNGNNQLQTLLDNRKSLFEQSLNQYNIWAADTENEAANLALVNIQAQLEAAQQALNDYAIEYEAYKENILSTASGLNQSIVTTSTMEANLKTINNLKIKYLLTGILSESEWSITTQIAKICPFNGAYASAVAKNLLAWNKQLVNADNSCNGNSAGKVKTTKSNTALVYPNPVMNELNIQYQGKGNTLNAEIYDISGKLILTQGLAIQNQNTLDVADFKNGFYIINLIEDNKVVATERFVKIN